jgi:hypothetical protein
LLCLATLLPAAALADGTPAGYPICNVPGDQLAPVALPSYFPGYIGLRGAQLFWQDLRGYPGDPGDLWYAVLAEPYTGDIMPVDGAPVVQRPGEQSQPAATEVWRTWSGCQWCGYLAIVLGYADADGLSPDRVVRARRMFDQPEHSWDVAVSDSTLDAFDPMAVGDRAAYDITASGALVGWLEAGKDGTTRLRAQHLGPDGSRLWGAGGLPVVMDASGQSDARMRADGADGAFFVWADSRHGDDLAIYAMRLANDGSPAPGWPAAGRLVRTSAALPQSPFIAPDGAGGLLVLWHELETLADLSHGLQPRLVRLLGDGSLAPGWPAAGVRLVVRDDAPLYVSDVGLDGVGGVYAAMTAVGPSGGRVFVQRLLTDGTRPAGWPAAGLEACASTGSQGEPKLAADGGVVTAVWRDERDGEFEADIYAARFLADGSRPGGWPAAGLAIGQAAGIQRSPVVAARLYGGVAVAWSDGRSLGSSGWDIWGQTVNADGRLDVPVADMPRTLELALQGAQPARGNARFRLGLAQRGRVTADVYDLAGRRLAKVLDGVLEAGWHSLAWSAGDEAGAGAPGVRFLRVRTGSGERTLRFVTLR